MQWFGFHWKCYLYCSCTPFSLPREELLQRWRRAEGRCVVYWSRGHWQGPSGAPAAAGQLMVTVTVRQQAPLPITAQHVWKNKLRSFIRTVLIAAVFRRWMAFCLWSTGKAASFSCRTTWRSTCSTSKRSWSTPACTTLSMMRTEMSFTRTCRSLVVRPVPTRKLGYRIKPEQRRSPSSFFLLSFFFTAPNGPPWGGDVPRQKSRTFSCRMLVNHVHGQSHGMSEERAGGQRYETMQCFALTQPRAMMEEGDGNYFSQLWMSECFSCIQR